MSGFEGSFGGYGGAPGAGFGDSFGGGAPSGGFGDSFGGTGPNLGFGSTPGYDDQMNAWLLEQERLRALQAQTAQAQQAAQAGMAGHIDAQGQAPGQLPVPPLHMPPPGTPPTPSTGAGYPVAAPMPGALPSPHALAGPPGAQQFGPVDPAAKGASLGLMDRMQNWMARNMSSGGKPGQSGGLSASSMAGMGRALQPPPAQQVPQAPALPITRGQGGGSFPLRQMPGRRRRPQGGLLDG